MASLLMGCFSFRVVLLLGLLMISSFHSVMCAEFDVGGDEGWIVPSSDNDQLFNKWASKNRLKVGDSLLTKEECDKCKSSHPMFFSNNGDTVSKVDKPGLFYFISGVVGHCDRGLKMIVNVLEPESPPPPPPPSSSGSSGCGGVVFKEAGLIISSSTVAVGLMTTMSFFGALFFI